MTIPIHAFKAMILCAIVSSSLLFGCATGSAGKVRQMVTESAKPYPELQIKPRPKPIANGWRTLLEASDVAREIGFVHEATIRVAMTNVTALEAVARDKILESIKEIDASVILLDKAIRFDVIEAPNAYEARAASTELRQIRTVVGLRLLRADQADIAGDSDYALSEIQACLKLARAMQASGGGLMVYRIGLVMEGNSLFALRRFAARQAEKGNAVARLLDLVPMRDPSNAAIKERIAREYLERVGPLIGSSSPEAMTEFLSDSGLGGMVNMVGTRRQKIDLMIEEALSEHQEPFNAAETMRVMSEYYSNAIKRVDAPWSPAQPPDAIDDYARIWPDDVLYYRNPAAEYDENQKRSLGSALSQVDNPFGRLVARRTSERLGEIIAFERTIAARVIGTRAFLSILEYERKNGKLPRALSELGKFPDPFGTGELEYDPSARKLWSRYLNGRDDGGGFREDSVSPRSTDLMWRIP